MDAADLTGDFAPAMVSLGEGAFMSFSVDRADGLEKGYSSP
jgi:hypothetical protein